MVQGRAMVCGGQQFDGMSLLLLHQPRLVARRDRSDAFAPLDGFINRDYLERISSREKRPLSSGILPPGGAALNRRTRQLRPELLTSRITMVLDVRAVEVLKVEGPREPVGADIA